MNYYHLPIEEKKMNQTPKLDLRFVFEKKAKQFFPEVNLDRNAAGNYTNSITSNLFEGFKLGLELMIVPSKG